MPNPMPSRIRVLLLSEDHEYSRNLSEFSATAGIDVLTMPTLSELGSIGYLGQCDVLLVDSQLGPLQGRDVVEYAEAFFPGLPVLVAATSPGEADFAVPQAIGGFFCKSGPLADVVSLVKSLRKMALATRPMAMAAGESGSGSRHLDP